MTDPAHPHAASTGHAQAAATWLDARFALNRVAYEAQLDAVGLQPGWRVLDAGCGSGQFLPRLADLVGPTGQLDALDLAPENIAALDAKLAQQRLRVPVTSCVGSLLALPYPDGAFDAVWCANTTQYLTDDELVSALTELRRVVRPGGLVALKESDATLYRLLPAPCGLMSRAFQAAAALGGLQEHGSLRAAELPAWLRRAGLTDIRRTTTLLESAAPLSLPAREQWRSFLPFCLARFGDLALPETDHVFWANLRAPEQREALLDDPDFYWTEGNTLAVGRVGSRSA